MNKEKIEYETEFRGNKYKFITDNSWVSVYVNGEFWGVPQGDRFLRALLEDIQKLKAIG